MNEYATYCDPRIQTGYSTMLMVKEPGDTLYSLLVTSESVPTVFGTPDTFEYDLLQCSSKGATIGKDTVENAEMEVFWHRDNILRIEALQNRVLDFLVFYPDYSARTFSATIRFRPNEATAENLKGTMSIIPIKINTETILDARDLIKLTVCFANTIPNAVTVTSATSTVLPIETSPFLTGLSVGCDNASFSVTATSPAGTSLGSVTITMLTTAVAPQYGIVKVTGSTADYAPWTTTVAVKF